VAGGTFVTDDVLGYRGASVVASQGARYTGRRQAGWSDLIDSDRPEER
jgi:hypothetical protein